MPLRLINVNTLRMEVFLDDATVPDYAILSHTWVEGEEVDFQEMTRAVDDPDLESSTRKKSGFGKIVKTCERARDCGVEFAWVDTCCIDKTNSSELSEAINSMFKWYHQSTICFAFLSDFPAGLNEDQRKSALAACRWFTRGWTLQELLAPDHLELFDAEWESIGPRWEFSDTISEITNIRVDCLDPSYPALGARLELFARIPIAVKMSWASGRTTTRPEDMAYSLLGLFDVNMPMLYGEGEKAFLRLQEEIIKRSNDLSIFFFSETPRFTHYYHGEFIDESDPPVVRDLMANSPARFTNSGICLAREGWSSRSHADRMRKVIFSLTNNGLLVRDADLEVVTLVAGGACYFLNVGSTCGGPRHPHTLCSPDSLFLCKIGPGRFARLDNHRLVSNGTRFPREPTPRAPDGTSAANPGQGATNTASTPIIKEALHAALKEDIYITVHPQDPFDFEMYDSHETFVQLRLNGSDTPRWMFDIKQVEPLSLWDAASMAFLRPVIPEAPFAFGFMRICTYYRSETERHLSVDFYVAFYTRRDIDDRDDKRDLTWVQVYSPNQWRQVQVKYETEMRLFKSRWYLSGDSLPDSNDVTSHEISIPLPASASSTRKAMCVSAQLSPFTRDEARPWGYQQLIIDQRVVSGVSLSLLDNGSSSVARYVDSD